ncbi:MAG: carbohydrate ABC transporter permease [Lachnospiraceae bacterium]|nr:MAG: carbohydrate ABC transporter permease [Lachnospiraceae bacterium]
MKIFKKVLYVFALLIFLIFYLGPFIWTFIISITPDSMVLEKSLNFLPDNTTLKNYLLLFDISSRQGKLLFSGMRNAIYASFVTIVLCIPMALLSAYALSRFKFFGKDFIKNSLLITMAIPVMATIIPIYKMFMQLKLLNNMYALSLVYVTSYLPVIVWLMSNYFSSIPRDLDEAAMVDGCTKTEALIYVVLPLSYPIIASAVLIIFLSTWSQFQIPLILASNNDTKPIAIITSEFITKDTVHYGLTAAAGILAIIPPALLALVFRKFLVSGIMKGSVKG